MIRFSILATILVVAQTIGCQAQSQSDTGLRGSTPVVAPRTLTERRVDRQRGLLATETDTRQPNQLPALPDPFDTFSSDTTNGTPANRSNVFSDLDDASTSSGDNASNPAGNGNNVPTPRARQNGTAVGTTNAIAASGDLNARTGRAAGLENAEAARGPLDGQTLRGDALTQGPRATTDQNRTFADRPGADDLFLQQEQTYDPLGLRVGSFVVLPSVTVTGGYTDNTSQANSGTGGAFYRIAPEIIARSDWSRHQVDATFRGSFQGFPTQNDDNNPAANLIINGRIDAGRATTVNLGATYDLQREDQSNPDVSFGDTDGILAQTIGGTANVSRLVGLVGLTVGGSVTRQLFTGGALGVSTGSAGATVTGSDDRSNTEVLGTLRVSLENEASIRPFVQASGGRREFDGDADALGFDRDSTIIELRGGTVLDLSPKFTGEFSAGYRNENVNDNNLQDLRGIVFDASLIWSPDRVTLVTLTGTTDFDPTTIDGATGSIVYSGTASVRRSLRSNLTLDAGVGVSLETFKGFSQEDIRTNANLGLTWDINRNAALTAQYNYDRLDSTADGSNFDSNSIEVGVRLQR